MRRIESSLRSFARAAFRTIGYDICRTPPIPRHLIERHRILTAQRVDLVIDVGANHGQFGRMLRDELRYAGRLHSIEPLLAAFTQLERTASHDPRWTVQRLALGDSTGDGRLHIAGNSFSSSLLPMTQAHADAAPHTAYVGQEEVPLGRLDDHFEHLCGDAKSIYLKLDTQGSEEAILRGATSALPRIDLIEMEMSLIPLYEGAPLFFEQCARMQERGYALVDLEREFSDPVSGRLLQVNGTFQRLASKV